MDLLAAERREQRRAKAGPPVPRVQRTKYAEPHVITDQHGEVMAEFRNAEDLRKFTAFGGLINIIDRLAASTASLDLIDAEVKDLCGVWLPNAYSQLQSTRSISAAPEQKRYDLYHAVDVIARHFFAAGQVAGPAPECKECGEPLEAGKPCNCQAEAV